ncbi:hypothetical protein ACFQZJ_05810 [Maribacter chungangensis]|uniref:Uncharacterized protein n=1 Tax=Maribacter chungangensis TaxID=1069117 RepID=A0ABW3B299_9FLAO
MELIYRNDYAAVYRVQNSPHEDCDMQLVVDTVGLFVSRGDLEHLMGIVQRSDEPCTCADCGGNACNKIWCSNPLIDICLKVDKTILALLEDVIKGTQFTLDLDATLAKYRLN